MHWLVGNWQLKLVSIVLTLALLAAVAFTTNPPTTASVDLHIAYPTPSEGLVLVNPPTKVQVRVVGLADSVHAFEREYASSAGARVDLTGMKAGADQPATAVVTASASGVSVTPSSMPISISLDTMETVHLPITVKVTNLNSSAGISVVQSGTYATCGSDTVMCEVTVHAPSSLVSGLTAYLIYVDPQPSQAGLERVPGLPVRFEHHGKPINLTGANPQVIPNLITVQPTTATARVETQGGTLTSTYTVFAKTSGTAACGYQVESLSYSPQTVTVSGPTQTLASLQQIQLSGIDVSGLNAPETVSRPLDLPSGVQASPGTPATVSVTVNIGQAFSCAPSTISGTPTPQSTPQPAPTRTPTPAPTPVPTPTG
jgi:YbbR domain-containing protein